MSKKPGDRNLHFKLLHLILIITLSVENEGQNSERTKKNPTSDATGSMQPKGLFFKQLEVMPIFNLNGIPTALCDMT